VYPKLILELLPAGLVGLVVAGFFAATMVSIASILNSASTVVTIDVIRPFKPDLSSSDTVRVGRWVTAGLLVVAVAWAPQLHNFASLWQYLQAVLAYAVPPVVAVFLTGMFWRGANADGAAATMIVGSVCGLILFFCNAVMGWTHIHFLYVAPLLALTDTVILVAASARRPVAVNAKSDAIMWKAGLQPTQSMRLARTPLWQDYRCLAAVLLALTVCVVVTFR
jgi:SSS family solute:Na+ symporter